MRKIGKLVMAAMLALSAGLIAPPAQSAQSAQSANVFVLDKPHTQIGFTINRMGYTKINGWFRKFDGEVTFDADNLAGSSVTATIMTDSIDSGFKRRDDHLRSPSFFNVKEFPEMTFVSTGIEKTGSKTGKMTGDLTMLGVTKPVTLDVVFNKIAPHPRNQKIYAGFSASGTLDRTAFGMTFLAPGVGANVTIRIEALTQKK